MKRKIGYGYLNDLVDDLIEQDGITNAVAALLTIIACRMNDKAKMLEHQLKEGELCSTPDSQ